MTEPTPPTPQPQPAPLPERVQYWADLLRPVLTSTQEVVDLAGTPVLLDYAGTEGAEPNSYDFMPSAVELEGPAADRERVIEFLCALAEHQAAALAAAQEREAALRAALTPSTETKAAYMGEFQFETEVANPAWNEDTDEEEPEYLIEKAVVPWDTIKQIMAAISARAALGGNS